MATLWRLKPFDLDRIRALSRETGVSSLVAQILINRGISEPGSAREFLEARLSQLHDPALLPGVSEAADRIVQAVRDGRKIVIYGDYDVDGVCGTSILWGCLRLAGAKDVDYYIPHRVDEGSALNPRGTVSDRRGDGLLHCGDGRLRHFGQWRGGLGARAGLGADHHRPPYSGQRSP